MSQQQRLQIMPNMNSSSTDNTCPGQDITNAMLLEWLARGNGIAKFKTSGMVTTLLGVSVSEECLDRPINKDVVIRKFREKEWHVPTKEYMEI